jgi:predicted DNA-binding transcriptional regulator YafY
VVQPLFVGPMEYQGHPYLGMEAYCLARREKRIFSVDRILDIAEPPAKPATPP